MKYLCILLDRHLDPKGMKDDDRMTIVFVGEGGAQNGRMAECLNAAAKEKLPILFLVIIISLPKKAKNDRSEAGGEVTHVR